MIQRGAATGAESTPSPVCGGHAPRIDTTGPGPSPIPFLHAPGPSPEGRLWSPLTGKDSTDGVPGGRYAAQAESIPGAGERTPADSPPVLTDPSGRVPRSAVPVARGYDEDARPRAAGRSGGD